MSNLSTEHNKLNIRQSNSITNARYSYTKVEKNVMYQVLVELNNLIRQGVTASDLFDQHLTVFIPYARLKKFDPSDNMSRNLKTAISSLRKKDFGIKTATGWTDTGFTTFATYVKDHGLTLEISKALVPELIEITSNFTAYDAVIAMSLQSKYAQRFYELCCRWRDTKWFEFTPATLNEMLVLDLQVSSLNERVIEPARKELHELYVSNQCDLYFTVEAERGGKGRGGSVKKWRFHVITRDAEKQLPDAGSEDYAYMMNYFKKAWSSQPDLINKAADLILTSNRVKIVADRLAKIKSRNISNLGGYLRTVLKDEFNIKL